MSLQLSELTITQRNAITGLSTHSDVALFRCVWNALRIAHPDENFDGLILKFKDIIRSLQDRGQAVVNHHEAMQMLIRLNKCLGCPFRELDNILCGFPFVDTEYLDYVNTKLTMAIDYDKDKAVSRLSKKIRDWIQKVVDNSNREMRIFLSAVLILGDIKWLDTNEVLLSATKHELSDERGDDTREQDTEDVRPAHIDLLLGSIAHASNEVDGETHSRWVMFVRDRIHDILYKK